MSKPLKKPASERSKDKGPPADPTTTGQSEVDPGVMSAGAAHKMIVEEGREKGDPELRSLLDRTPQPDYPPASTTRGGYEGYEQGEATEREPTDISMPPEWKGTESQWEALSPQKKEQFVADTQEAHRASQMYVPLHER